MRERIPLTTVSNFSKPPAAMAENSSEKHQTVFLMRHGARHDAIYPDWKATASRPYDTPLSRRGDAETPQLVRERLVGKGIEVIVSSPFLRCIQTATHAYKVLKLPGLHISNMLCEWLVPGNNMTGTPQVPALQDATETIFLSQDPTPFPQFPETLSECHARYRAALDSLADLYWPRTILLVTHQACVQEAARWGGKEEDVEAVYCAHVQLGRTSKESHDWKWEGDGGIYVYDVVI